MAKRQRLQIPALFGRNRVLAALAQSAGASFLVDYLSDPSLPRGAADPLSGWFSPTRTTAAGWFGFHDQGQYLRMAHGIAGGIPYGPART